MENWLPILFFIIALLYASVGFGGGSSYLAIMSIFMSNFYEIRSTALVLNLVVVSIGSFAHWKEKQVDWNAFWPFLLPSVPLAFLGAQLRLSERTFFLILGSLLLFAGIAMLLKFIAVHYASREFKLWKRSVIGGGIGFFAGLTGIGGGIYLSPVLNLMGWKDARKIAALASIFILTNSLAGLLGLIIGNTFEFGGGQSFKLVIAVFWGGLMGAYLSLRKINTKWLGILTALLVIYVGTRLIALHGYGIKI